MKRCLLLVVAIAITLAGCPSNTQVTLPPPGSSAQHALVVGDVSTNVISTFPITATGNVAPSSTISGAATSINQPFYLFIDGSSRIWASNYAGGSTSASITAYAPGASGNAMPVVKISGASTQLVGSCGIFLKSDRTIYTAQCNGASILIFAPGSNGNVAPSTVISGSNTGLSFTEGITVDSAGNIYVADDSSPPAVRIFAAGSSGNVAPSRVISGANTLLNSPDGIALDGAGNIYVGNCNGTLDSVVVFAAGASGNVAPMRVVGPTAALSCVYGVAVDAAGNVHTGQLSNPAVLAYPPSASGPSATPSQTLTGSNTGFSEPAGLAIQ